MAAAMLGAVAVACGGTSSAPAVPATSAPAAASGTSAGASEGALVSAAKQEGRATVYAVFDPSLSQALTDAMNTRYGIDVTFERLNSGPLAQRYSAEQQAGNVVADVVAGGDPGFLNQAKTNGWLAPVGDLPALAAWPKAYWDGTLATVAIYAFSIAYNTQVVGANVPKTWSDLLDPRLRGQILFNDPRNSVLVLDWMYLMREEYGDDYLRKLSDQQLNIVSSAIPGSQQLAAGSAGIFIPGVHQALTPLLAQGAPIVEVFPEPTTGGSTFAGISSKAPHPNAARLVLNFLMSVDGQAILNKDSWSVMPNVPGTRELPKGWTPSKDAEAAAAQNDLVRLVGLSG